jgi:uncharacterized protein YjbJ (UPF0337 family)
MGAEDKAADKGKEVKGKIKKTVGRAVGNRDLEAEGRADQSEGDIKQAGEKVKDAFKKLSGRRQRITHAAPGAPLVVFAIP